MCRSQPSALENKRPAALENEVQSLREAVMELQRKFEQSDAKFEERLHEVATKLADGERRVEGLEWRSAKHFEVIGSLEGKVLTAEEGFSKLSFALENGSAVLGAKHEELQRQLKQSERKAAKLEDNLAALTEELHAKVDRTYVEMNGFSGKSSNLNTRFYVDPLCRHGGHPTYWTANGAFVLSFHGQAGSNRNPWAIQTREHFHDGKGISVAVCTSCKFEEAKVWYQWAGSAFELTERAHATTCFLPVGKVV